MVDRPVRVSGLVVRYMATTLFVLVVVAVVTAYASRALGIRAAVEDANRDAGVIARAAVQPVLTDAVVGGDPAAVAALDRVVRTQVLDDSLIRVKIWNADGVILYSDEYRLIGDRFDLGPEELEVLRSGGSEAELSDLSEPENRFEEPATELLEVYLPVRTAEGRTLLFEAYFRYGGIAESGRRLWLRFAPFTLGALVLLALLQVPLALSLGRRLRRTQVQREDLLRRALESTQEERRRIAADLHDGVVQDLAGVAFSLAASSRQQGRAPAEARATEQAADKVRDAVRSLRSLLVEIYPPNLYDEGLESALSDLLARAEPRGLRTSLEITAPLEDLDVETVQLLYRVAQEGVRNVVTHADAARVAVAVSPAADGGTVLRVTDDGRGRQPVERPGHLGLRALGGLAATMGATLTLTSTPGKGTVLALEVPAP